MVDAANPDVNLQTMVDYELSSLLELVGEMIDDKKDAIIQSSFRRLRNLMLTDSMTGETPDNAEESMNILCVQCACAGLLLLRCMVLGHLQLIFENVAAIAVPLEDPESN